MSEVLTLTPEERKAITTAASPLITAARACVVSSQVDYSKAADQLKAIKAAQQLLKAKKDKLMNPLKAAVAEAKALFAAPETELDEAEGLYKRAMIAYADEQDRLRREEQARLDREAAAERERKEAASRKALQDAEAARAAGNEKKAERLETKAETLADTAATIVAPQAQRAAPKAKGVSQAEYWSGVVVDFEQLVIAVAATIMRNKWSGADVKERLESYPAVPITALLANQPVLNQMARSLKRELKWPGVTPVRETGLRAGTGK